MTDRRSEGLTSPLWFSVQFGALLVLGVVPATLIAALGTAVQRVKELGFRGTVVPTATVTVAALASGLVFTWLSRFPNERVMAGEALVVAATVATYCVVIGGLTFLSRSLASGSVDRSWMSTAFNDLRNCVIVASATVLVVHALSGHRWDLLSFVLLPLYFVANALRDVRRGEKTSSHREAIINSLEEGVCVVNLEGRITLWNAALEKMLNCPRSQAIGRTFGEAVPVLAETTVASGITAAIKNGRDPGVLRLTLPTDAGDRVLQTTIVSSPTGVTLVWSDVTLGSMTHSALKQSEERFALMESSINDGLWEWDLRAQVVRYSGQWRNIVGLASTSATGAPEEWFDRVHPDDLGSLKQAIDAILAGNGEELLNQHRLKHEDGTYRHVLCRGSVVRGARQRPVRLGGSLIDITERAEAERSLLDSGTQDPLTGLCNRTVFVEALGQRLIALKKRQGGHFAVLFLDLDRFKMINDTLGHLVGDELLIGVSRRLESCLREGDSLARLGGDEFAIFLNELRDENQATAVALRIEDLFTAAFPIGGRDVFTSTSIGIAFSAFRYESPDEIMRDADTAMYHAKARGKARHEVFDENMHAQAVDRRGLEDDLRLAARDSAFQVHYQPIVSLNSGACVGFEALARWTRNGKDVPPARFIPIAEELGLIDSVGTWVLREACRTFANWLRRFPESGFECITVNVSSRQLVQHGFFHAVEEALRDANLPPGKLRLEITETALLTSRHTIAGLLQQLRELGVRIYLDDFGTGHSSLSHLHQVPVDALKIDRSLVNGLLLPDRPAIVESILALAYTLDAGVVAEGVEDETQALALDRLGCRHAQGFLFSPPVPGARIEELLKSGEPLVASRRLIIEDRSTSTPMSWADRATADANAPAVVTERS